MTCQHCQTWILDGDHRCSRCGRRVKNTPSRISPNTYPIAATATAPAFDYHREAAVQEASSNDAIPEKIAIPGQQSLFSNPVNGRRVIAFESLATHTDRESIRARAALSPRPAPLKTTKVEVRHARPRRSRSTGQRTLEFEGQEHVLPQPQSSIICDAPVAPLGLRLEAGLIDAVLMALGCVFVTAVYRYVGGPFSLDKHALPFFALALLMVPLSYKLLWTFVNRDTTGMRCAGLRLVDFDGNPPSHARRFHRLLGAILSFSAAGVGLIWSLVDEDGLTWHDHISGTFPAIGSE